LRRLVGRGGGPEIAHWIHRRVVDANFVVQVRAGSAATNSHIADYVPTLHAHAPQHGKAREMAIPACDTKAMIDDDHLPVAGVLSRFNYHAIRTSSNALTIFARDVYAGMERSFSTEWVQALAKLSRDRADYRPERRSEASFTQLEIGDQAQSGVCHSRRSGVLLQECKFRQRVVE
jgi:hypothetical protein